MKVTKIESWLVVDVKEERLNQLSDLAIGEAMGGDLGDLLANNARRNLAALDEVPRPSRAPERIQRRRTKGWRMPERAVYVGRPSRWGNPFRMTRGVGAFSSVTDRSLTARLVVVRLHRAWVTAEVKEHLTIDLEPLRGRDLVCWCPLDQPCHADVLLELANA